MPRFARGQARRLIPTDWRQQTPEQKAAINQFHIAADRRVFRRAGKKVKQRAADLPLDQRLANYIIEGTKDGLIAISTASWRKAPRHSMSSWSADGGDERGRPTVQQQRADRRGSAAIGRIDEGWGELPGAIHGEGRQRFAGKVILATVKGDVHDIGKNLVEIIFSNNGYNVVNLGSRCRRTC